MKNIFLCSSFSEVVSIFETFAGAENKGKIITFIATASLVEEVTFYVDTAKKTFEKMGFIIDELEISTAKYSEIKEKIQQNDFIYISGGNTFFLLQELKKSGADTIIIEEIKKGKTYIGESAGSMVLSSNIEYVTLMDDVAKAPELQSFVGLDVIDFYPVPHYTNFPFLEAVETIISEFGKKIDLCPITNSQAIIIHEENKEIKTV